ncbi:MAG TPA: hypothetical protein VMP67_01790 [Candidatus Limnocylindria bacterium]|nr:hypothetical protein [Candidatus Limnocylindria bacterium]
MEIQLAPERVFLLEARLSAEDAERKAMDRRAQAIAGGLGGLLQRPRPEDIVLVARQHRLEPFWHVACSATYVYERRREYKVPASAPEVQAVTVEGTRYEMERAASSGPRSFRLTALEHCRDEFRKEVFSDGLSGSAMDDGSELIGGPRSEVADMAALAAEGTIVVPPEQRASFVVRKALADVMKPVQADKILEESVALEATDLYYRPMWAFEFAWAAKGKQGVVEVDGLTGASRQGKPLIGQLRGMITRDLLFDVGADTVGLLVPGGSIAVRLAQAAIDRK